MYIEIDGEWCHDKDYDNMRDKHIRSLGIEVVRIDTKDSIDVIKEKLEKFNTI